MSRRQVLEMKFPRAVGMPQPENCLPCKSEFKPQHVLKKSHVMNSLPIPVPQRQTQASKYKVDSS